MCIKFKGLSQVFISFEIFCFQFIAASIKIKTLQFDLVSIKNSIIPTMLQVLALLYRSFTHNKVDVRQVKFFLPLKYFPPIFFQMSIYSMLLSCLVSNLKSIRPNLRNKLPVLYRSGHLSRLDVVGQVKFSNS